MVDAVRCVCVAAFIGGVAGGVAMGRMAAGPGIEAAPTTKPMTDNSLRAQADELERRWADQYLKYGDEKEIARLNDAAAAALKSLGPDGRFGDLSYGPIITGRDGGAGWGEHLIRTADLFTAWRLPGTRYAGSEDVARRAGEALDAYLAAPFDARDRWGFGHPYANLLESNRIGRCCLFARSAPQLFPQDRVQRWADHITARAVHPIFVPSDEPARQFSQVSRGWEGGANVLWATRGELVPFLINADQDLRVRAIDAYMNHIWSSQTVRWPKGPLGQIERLTVDGMLGEHSAPAVGSYGEWYINAVVEYRNLVQGVPRWQMPPSLNAHWVDVLLDSVAYCYQGAVDPHLGNPLVWLNARKNGNAKLKEWLTAFSGNTPHRAAEVKRMLDWEPGVTAWPNPSQSVRYWYSSDYMTKHYPMFMASVRAVSERTFGMETFAQKDKRWAIESVLLPLGTTFVRRDTREFQDLAASPQGVFGALDYARLPGQTTRHVAGDALAAAWNRDASGFAVRMVFGGTPYSGAATDGRNGVMAWWQSRYVTVDRDRPNELKRSDLSVNGRRAVFFLDDAVVHLGAAFDVRHESLPTFTNLEQRASGAEVTTYAVAGERRELRRGDVVREANVSWVWHEGVGYLPPADGIKVVQDVLQPGQPGAQVFSFWTDHGREAADLSFEWAVLPDVKVEDMPDRVTKRSWRVVANTPLVQAVEVPATAWAGVAFHAPESVEALGVQIEVDRPAVLSVRREGVRFVVDVGDPLQQGGPLRLRVDGDEKLVELSAYPHLGRPVRVELSARPGERRPSSN
jgi:hypothetical protein